jgi:hypothetical protein
MLNPRSCTLKFLTSLVVLVVSLALFGCGSSAGPRLPTIPVKGKLLIDGKPFGPCVLSLGATTVDPDPKLAAAAKTVTGSVKADGTFVLTTYVEGDGAPVGTYNVVISSDISKPEQLNPVPVCKPLTVDIAKSTDGKPLEIELKLESTGESSMSGNAMKTIMP